MITLNCYKTTPFHIHKKTKYLAVQRINNHIYILTVKEEIFTAGLPVTCGMKKKNPRILFPGTKLHNPVLNILLSAFLKLMH